MDSYLLAIRLPHVIQARLAAICFGLPQVQWVEEGNFHLTLRHFPHLNSHILRNITEQLTDIFFQSFPIVLQGVGHFHTKGNRGSIWIGIVENLHLVEMRKEIDRLLRTLCLEAEEYSFHPHVTLGYYDQLNPKRLGDFLTTYADFASLPFEISKCSLMRALKTPKHMIYEIVQDFASAEKATGQD